MLIIFVFFSVISMSLVGCFAVAVLNVVIRRESAYLVEERIKLVVYQRKELIDAVKDGEDTCTESRSNSLPRSATRMVCGPKTKLLCCLGWSPADPSMLRTTQPFFAGVVSDRGHLEIRSFHKVEREECSAILTARVVLDDPFLKQVSKAAGLQIVDTKPALWVHTVLRKEFGGRSKLISFPARGARFLLLSSRRIGKQGSLRIGWYARSVRVIRGR
jgi:hypothetical protein